jgi:hypothetical protein
VAVVARIKIAESGTVGLLISKMALAGVEFLGQVLKTLTLVE